tara:strand:+ start:203 stop:580 length:378 start_codon:yes stop_codon:yes gene_type:complete
MASNVRFVDSLKVGAYNTNNSGGGGGSGITINNNVNNYLLSATGNPNIINGEANLQFDGQTLSVIGNVTINDSSGNDLILIQNASNKGLKVTSDGTLQLFEFTSLPTAIEGGIAYSSNEFYVGLG